MKAELLFLFSIGGKSPRSDLEVSGKVAMKCPIPVSLNKSLPKLCHGLTYLAATCMAVDRKMPGSNTTTNQTADSTIYPVPAVALCAC
eukprot:4479738-Amphidinium_carterae.1